MLMESPPDLRVKGAARRARYRHLSEPEQQRVGVWLERLYQRRGLNYADPWSDRRLFELALALPQRVLNSPAEPKRLVKQAMQGVMPEEALRRTGKVYPAAHFFRGITTESREAVRDLIMRPVSGALGYVNEDRLVEAYRQVESGEPSSHDLWHALTLEMWLRAYWV
jgi:asparagine synthase (glutamine-hydrolysing)